MSLRHACALLPLLAAAASAAPSAEQAWSTTMTLHFVVHHEGMHLPSGLLSDVEHSYQKIARELWSMNSGMQGSKIDFYLYPTRERYLAGRFSPPPWSAGRSLVEGFPNRKLVFVTYQGVRNELLTHELTHLFFGAFWKRDDRPPPLWLNEGLAVLMEGRKLAIKEPMSLKELFEKGPAEDDPAARVSDWYAQSGSVVTFLLKGRSNARFKILAEALRDGLTEQNALRHAYGFGSVDELEKAWTKWREEAVKRDAK